MNSIHYLRKMTWPIGILRAALRVRSPNGKPPLTTVKQQVKGVIDQGGRALNCLLLKTSAAASFLVEKLMNDPEYEGQQHLQDMRPGCQHKTLSPRVSVLKPPRKSMRTKQKIRAVSY
jgi:hypothetical protein